MATAKRAGLLSRKVSVKYLTALLLVVLIAISYLNFQLIAPLKLQSRNGVMYNKETNTIYLQSMTLDQKIAQMIIADGDNLGNKEFYDRLNIGGVFMRAKDSRGRFRGDIEHWQLDAKIPYAVAADVEGCFNALEVFQPFPALKDIKTPDEAYKIGQQQGQVMKELGFTINFSPVVDLEDKFWKCRTFTGTPEEIATKAEAYIAGLQSEGIIATAKHYPGGTLNIADPHKNLLYAVITKDDLLPFKQVEGETKAIMISHQIASGEVDSEGKPSVGSKKLTAGLRSEFLGLIITDDTRMYALTNYYFNDKNMYLDLFKANNDYILIISEDPKTLPLVISSITLAAKLGTISQQRIDDSVERILKSKGFNVAR